MSSVSLEDGSRLTLADNLDDLAALDAAVNAYYYDSANSTLYLRNANNGIGWYRTSDFWTDAIWNGVTERVGPDSSSLEGDVYVDITDPNPVKDWYEIDVTGMVKEWLVDGKPNYGMRLVVWNPSLSNIPANFASRENPDDSIRPELIVDYSPADSNGTLILLR